MTDFKKFNEMMDVKGLMKDVKEASERGDGDFPEVPLGNYEVQILSMEIGETGEKSKNPGSPMFKAQFKILEGSFKNSRLFMNQVLTTGFGIHKVNQFLKSLGTNIDVEFGGDFEAYNNMILDILEAVDGNFEFGLKYGETDKGFKTFDIVEVFEVE